MGLLLSGLSGVSALAPRVAFARGRSTNGGKIALRLPWPIGGVDPHRLDDPLSAILGDALFDTLYARDEAGAFVPSLAERDPEPDGANLRVTVRAGVRLASGRPLDARDAVASIARARARGARAWLAPLPVPRLDGKNALLFAMKDAPKLTRALASPVVAIVPSAFAPALPDGTGPFRAERRGPDVLALVRNLNAARGPSFLDEVVVRSAPDLAASLRAFESGADDVGWLGSGLHEPRPGSKAFDGGAVAWAVLRTGRDAGTWDAPGVAQRIADGIPPSRLAYLALGPAWSTEAEQGWGGAPCELLARDDAPWLIELARAVAATISRPGHEVTVRTISMADFAQRRTSRTFALALDVVRPLAQGSLGALIALASADNPATADDLAKHPPRLAEVSPRTLTRTLRLGVLGDIRMQGGRVADIAFSASPSGIGFDFGATTRGARG